MLEIIGFLVWLLFTIGLTIFPILLAGLSGLGGGVGKTEAIIMCVIWLLAGYSWVKIFTVINISIG